MQWKAYSEHVSFLVDQLVNNWVNQFGLDGVDIDFEDTPAFQGTVGYNGVTFLTELSMQLASKMPGGNLLTHSPQTPYWLGGFLPDHPYVTIWNDSKGAISWVNNQFYNNPGFDGTPMLDVTNYETIVQTTGPEHAVLAMPVSEGAAPGGGYIDTPILIQDVIDVLLKQFPNQFGGVAGWEIPLDPMSAWANAIGGALNIG